MDLWELTARECIRDLVARYNANADAGRFAEVEALFTADAVVELTSLDGGTRTFEGRDAIGSLLAGTRAAWDPERDRVAAGDRGQAGGRHHVRHFVATHQIDLVDRDHARGRSYYLVLMRHGLDHWGRYVDEYEAKDGEWRIAHRRVLSDGHAPDALAGLAGGGETASPRR